MFQPLMLREMWGNEESCKEKVGGRSMIRFSLLLVKPPARLKLSNLNDSPSHAAHADSGGVSNDFPRTPTHQVVLG
jgi:hypothetical protein